MREVLAGLLLVAACTPGDVDVSGSPADGRLAEPPPTATPSAERFGPHPLGACTLTARDEDGVRWKEVWRGTREGLPYAIQYRDRDGSWKSAVWDYDERGNGVARVSESSWDGVVTRSLTQTLRDGRVVDQVYGYETTWDYDTDGRLVGFRQSGTGDAAVWKYDPDGRVVSVHRDYGDGGGPEDRTWRWDEEGRLASVSEWVFDGGWGATVTSWNDAGLPIAGTGSAGNSADWDDHVDFTWTWDDAGRPTPPGVAWTDLDDGGFELAVDSDESYRWDADGHLVEHRSDLWTKTYTWDDAGILREYAGTSDDGSGGVSIRGICPPAAWQGLLDEAPWFSVLPERPKAPTPFGYGGWW